MIPRIERNGTKARVMVEVDLSGSMMEMESKIQDALNIAGNRLTKEALEQFDTNGQPVQFGDIKFTAR